MSSSIADNAKGARAATARSRRTDSPSWMPYLIYAQDLLFAAVVMVGVIVVRYHFERPLPVDMVVRATAVFVLICAVVFPLCRT